MKSLFALLIISGALAVGACNSNSTGSNNPTVNTVVVSPAMSPATSPDVVPSASPS